MDWISRVKHSYSFRLHFNVLKTKKINSKPDTKTGTVSTARLRDGRIFISLLFSLRFTENLLECMFMVECVGMRSHVFCIAVSSLTKLYEKLWEIVHHIPCPNEKWNISVNFSIYHHQGFVCVNFRKLFSQWECVHCVHKQIGWVYMLVYMVCYHIYTLNIKH